MNLNRIEPTTQGVVKIYNGTMLPPPVSQGVALPPLTKPKNKTIVKRKVSTFNVILTLMATAAAIVLYINNIIRVNQLLSEITVFQEQHKRILMEQENYKKEINRLSSLERINRTAEDEIGLKNPKEAPVWIQIDEKKVRELERALQKQK